MTCAFRNLRGVAIWTAVYLVLAFVAVRLDGAEGLITSTWARTAVALLPMIGGAGVLLVTIRRTREMDELQQRQQLEGITFAFGATLLATVSYTFFERLLDAPALSAAGASAVMAVMWVLGTGAAWLRYR